MSNEIFNGIETPYAFSKRKLGGEITTGILEKNTALGELEAQKLGKVFEALIHPEIGTLIDEGKLTLGIVKAQANKGKNISENDQEAADQIMDEIGQENIVFSFSTKFNETDVELFYQDVKKKFTEDCDDKEKGNAIWQGISEHAQSGPLTFMLIYREEGDAVEWWRNRMGKTIDAEEGSIRGDHAIRENLPNNLVHGSDSIQSVKKEVGVLVNKIYNLLTQSAQAREEMFLPADRMTKKLLAIQPNRRIVAIQRKDVNHTEGLAELSLRAIFYNPREVDVTQAIRRRANNIENTLSA